MTRKYDSTVARIAGTLLSAEGDLFSVSTDRLKLVVQAVAVARAIVHETKLTEPAVEG